MNSLFIGLGGAGTNALGELQKKFREYRGGVNNYLYIDTDTSVVNKYPFVDTNGDFFSIGDGVKPDEVMTNIQKPQNQGRDDVKRINEWIDRFNPALRAPHDLSVGAAGLRMLTRMAMWDKYPKLKSTIKAKLNIANYGTVDRVYVVSGTAGGTGCGSLIDILFLLNEIKLEDAMIARFPKVNVMLAMPEGYIADYEADDPRKTSYPLNAYGLFTELNAVLKDYWSNVSFRQDAQGNYLDKDGNVTTNESEYVEIPNLITGKQWAKHSVRPINQALVSRLKFLPFDNAYMFDTHHESISIDFDVVSDRIANFIFSLEVADTVHAGLSSVFSNVLIASRIASAKEPSIKAFCSTGSFTVQTLEELRKKYVREKFIYQMMVHGLVGKDTDYPKPDMPNSDLWDHITELKERYCTEAWEYIKDLYENAEKTDLISCLKQMEPCSKKTTPKFSKLFPLLSNGSKVERDFGRLCEEVRQIVLDKCGEWIRTYNLRYARTLVDVEDNLSTRSYSNSMADIKKYEPQTAFFGIIIRQSKRDLWKNLENAFSTFINIMLNRYLSQGDDGCFDECRDFLDGIIRNIDIENYEISPKKKLVDWEGHYIRDVLKYKNDPTRHFIDGIDSLFSGIHLKPQDLPQKYAAIIRQSEDGRSPDMEYNTDGQLEPDSLPYYKAQILRSLQMDNNFRPDILKEEENCKYLLERFLKEVKVKADDVILNSGNILSDPIGSKIQDQTTRNDVAQKLFDAKETFLTMSNDDLTSNPYAAIYLGQFTSATGQPLEAQIRGLNGFSQTSNKIQDDISGYWSDRYTKIFVKMNYSLEQYSFFPQYRDLFERYYVENKNNWARHIPFSSIKFWECENADIVNLFNRGSEETRISQVRDSLSWNEREQWYAFSFMTVLLGEYYIKLMSSKGAKEFLTKFKHYEKGKTKKKPIQMNKREAFLTYSSDYIGNPGLKTYRVDHEDGIINITLNPRDIERSVDKIGESYNRFVKYWIRVIMDACTKVDTSIDPIKLYVSAYNKVFEFARDNRDTDCFVKLIEPYYNPQTQKMGERDFFEEYQLWFSK